MAGSDEQPLRVLHVLRAPLGGLFRHVLDLTREQVARGHKVGLVTDSLTGGERAAEVLADLAPQLELGLSRIPINRNPGWSDVTGLMHVVARTRAANPDIVHGHGSKGGAYARLPGFLWGGGRPVRAYTPHGGSFNYRPGAPIHKLYMAAERLFERRTDIFLFESAYIGHRFAESVGETTALQHVVLNGIGPAELQPVMPNPDAVEFVYVGELRAAKGIDTLIDAMLEVRRRTGATPRAVLAGSGPDLDKLRAQAVHHGLADSITFPGLMPARRAFAMGRIMIVPSRAESLPYVVLEAAGACVPMIATDVGGIPEIFGPYRSRLIPCNQPEILADSMMAQLALDEVARRKQAELLSKYVESRFTITNMVDAVIAGYREALASHGAARRFTPTPLVVSS